jgi:hypothetical protein
MVERQPGVQYGPVSNGTGLGWSISAMNGSVDRLYKAAGTDRPEALAIVTESVWWVTLVEASIQRSDQAAYNHTLLNLGPAERRAAEGTFIGLRFVRNWLGAHADPANFIQPEHDDDGGVAPVAAWTWTLLPTPELGKVSPRDRHADAVRYRDYCTYLARKPVGETITSAVAFLADVALM